MKKIMTRIQEKKLQVEAYAPLDTAVINNLGEWLRIELTYHSNAIEGNTLTRQQTARVVEDHLSVAGKHINEILEAINHDKALSLILELSKKKKYAGQEDILSIHRLILAGIDDMHAGSFRSVPVRISGSVVVLPNHLKVSVLMNEFDDRLKEDSDELALKAIEAHYRLVTIHPFIDGNGRTARLLFNLLLLKAGYPLSFVQKSEREEYIQSLEQAQLGGNKERYVTFMLSVIERSLDIYLESIAGVSPTNIIQNDQLLKIGELAKRGGLTVPTVRFWTQEGLLPIEKTTPKGYALYHPDCLKTIERINELKEQRYTLREIAAML